MIKKLSESRIWQLAMIIGLVIIVPLMIDINGRIGIIRRMRQRETSLQQEMAEAEQERAEIQAQLDALEEPAAVEEWARVEAHMTKPGEVAIIPIYSNATQPETPGQEETATAGAPLSISEQWYRLFFDPPAAP
jgi:cell division protein FtsB